MENKIDIYSVSSGYSANKLISVPEKIYPEITEKFKLKDDDCKFLVTRQFDHPLGVNDFYSYKIFDSTFSPIIKLNGIYSLTNNNNDNEFIENWQGQWNNKIVILTFESDVFDKYTLEISIRKTQQTIQQIAYVLEAIDNRTTKLTSTETSNLRSKLDNYLNIKKI